MKKITTVLTAISILICVASCDHDYPEEVTYSGENIHGFKLNGERWVRQNTGFNPSRCLYEHDNHHIEIHLYSVPENSDDSPSSAMYLIIQKDIGHSTVPLEFDFMEMNDSILFKLINSEKIDSTKCYCQFEYRISEGEDRNVYEVISGNIQLQRFDSLLVGTFVTKLTNGTDTLTLTEGKFDYQLTID